MTRLLAFLRPALVLTEEMTAAARLAASLRPDPMAMARRNRARKGWEKRSRRLTL